MNAISHASRQAAARCGRTALALVIAVLVAACYPELDWREVASAEGGYAVLLPDKPEHASRDVTIGNAQLKLNMASVLKEGMAFGVGYARLPTQAEAPAALLDQARDALVRNIGGRIMTERTVDIGGHAAREFAAVGMAQGEPMRLAARVLIADDRFYQVVFVGRRERGTDTDVSMFLESFRLLR